MKNCYVSFIKHFKKKIRLVPILLVTILFFGCAKDTNFKSVICDIDINSSYSTVLEETLPSFTIKQAENKTYFNLDAGYIVEAFDMQAVGALETRIAKYWYPQYLATVIIAIDREQTDSIVTSWSDLLETSDEVAFFDTPANVEMLTAAMSYGLEGKEYSLKKTIDLLSLLQKNERLKMNSFESPIIICYDYQAVALKEKGRNFEIIIPTEGTFTYEKGLLSGEELNFEEDVNKLLGEANFRLIDLKNVSSLYPDEQAYVSAVKVQDAKYFAKITEDVNCSVKRKVLLSKKYTSIDTREHLYFALIYIILVTIWSASVLRRSMQKGISYAAFLVGIILNGWTLVRLIKYQVEINPTLIRYLWYSFYIFQISLPLVMLWTAWVIDKPENETFRPKWLKIMSVIGAALIVFVFTNDLHGFVFHLDLTSVDWNVNYSYGFGYYVILFFCMLNLFAVFGILLHKSIKNPRKKRFVFPLIFFFLFGFYNYKYIIHDPIIFETDLTIVTGLFTMLMIEACIRSGLIPVNTKYVALFRRSPLKMQIVNKHGKTAFASASLAPLNKEIFEKLLQFSPEPIIQEDETLLFANSIPGGYAIWHEDISKLYKLHKEIHESTKMLKEANVILDNEEKLKRSNNDENGKKRLMEQLESEIAQNIEQMSVMIEKLPYSKNQLKETTGIALLLCYIKRRCNLFFQEKEKNSISADELIVYIDELSEIAKYSSVQIATTNELKGKIAIRYATLFYDFFYLVVNLSVQLDCTYIIEHMSLEEGAFIMRLLPSKDIGILKLSPNFSQAIMAVNGKVIIKKLEDTTGISLCFLKGGTIDD